MSYLLAVCAGIFSFVLGAAVMLQTRRSFASWCFFAGMTVFGVECLFQGFSIQSRDVPTFAFWQGAVWVAKSFLPGTWLAFSLSYSRGNYREFIREWRLGLACAAILPPAVALCFLHGLFLPPSGRAATSMQWLPLSPAGKFLNVLSLVGILLVLANFERTFQNTVGTMRWRVKFALLGFSLIFGARIYTRSLSLLFSRQSFSAVDVETGSLLLGCAMIGIAHLRRGFSDVDVYPSHTFLRNSVTLVLAGGYLFAVGVLAQAAKWLGGSSAFQWQVLVILGGVAGLGVLVLSERLRQRIRYFVSHHLRRPHHDFRQVWRELTARLARAHSATESCVAAAQMISETFNALSVTIWLAEDERRWILGASTGTRDVNASREITFETRDLTEITGMLEPFDLEQATPSWSVRLRAMTQQQFSSRTRLAIVLRAGQHALGIVVLGDRVNRVSYTIEELELLKCLADQLAAGLLNFRLRREVALARELETFQTMSAFFVHDLKNSASSLNLMLQNLPRHFDNPEFREDALRGLGRTADHINNLITKLSSFREQLELSFSLTDLDKLIAEVIEQLGPRPVLLSKELNLMQPLPLDREQIKSVVTNLITNAHEATPTGGSIYVKTEMSQTHAVLTVSDSGCGMSAEFLHGSLFRPFQTTKKKGIGIGMFQTRMIVEAHRGHIHVESAPQKGTRFQVTLPL